MGWEAVRMGEVCLLRQVRRLRFDKSGFRRAVCAAAGSAGIVWNWKCVIWNIRACIFMEG
ncbi:hypothetical protein D3C78_984030 [compost metagenome]